MNKTLKLSLASALLLALTACKSNDTSSAKAADKTPVNTAAQQSSQSAANQASGNAANQTGSSTDNTSNTTGQNNTAPSTPATPTTPAEPTPTTPTEPAPTPTNPVPATPVANTQEGVYWTSYDNLKNISKNAADTLILNGESIELLTSEGYTALDYSHFGWAVSKNQKDKDGDYMNYAYSYGQKTDLKAMPVTGSATYKGTAHFGSEGNDIIPADANFSVDFGKKTVDGVISASANNINVVLPTSKIEGNTFKSEKPAQGWGVSGAFYGPNADELSGIYDGDDKGIASFGAKKQ